MAENIPVDSSNCLKQFISSYYSVSPALCSDNACACKYMNIVMSLSIILAIWKLTFSP